MTVVTETDQAVEAFIKRSIADKYPSFKFIGEESFAGGERVDLTDEPTFIVDPIDGTTNFVSCPALADGYSTTDYSSLLSAGPRNRFRLSRFSPSILCSCTLTFMVEQVCCSIGFTYKQEPVIGCVAQARESR